MIIHYRAFFERIKPTNVKDYDTRLVTQFLWLPRNYNGAIYWLVWAETLEVYKEGFAWPGRLFDKSWHVTKLTVLNYGSRARFGWGRRVIAYKQTRETD